MMAYLHELKGVISSLKTEKIEEAAKAFVKAIADINSISLTTQKPLTVDFAALEVLFRLDQSLGRVNRNAFWIEVANLQKATSSQLLPDIQMFINDCMKVYPSADDLYRTSQLKHLSKQHNNLPGLQYLFALTLLSEGSSKADIHATQECLEIFKQLAPLAKGGVAIDGMGTQSFVFSQTRVNSLSLHLRLLEPKQALDILTQELNTDWTYEAGYLRDHLITRRESLADAVSLKEKMDKVLEEATSQYQTKHSEILIAFLGLVAFLLGALNIIPKQTVSNGLALIFGLSLGLIGALGISLAMLAPAGPQRSLRFVVGLLFLVSLGTWAFMLSLNEMAAFHIQERASANDSKVEKRIDTARPASEALSIQDGQSSIVQGSKT